MADERRVFLIVYLADPGDPGGAELKASGVEKALRAIVGDNFVDRRWFAEPRSATLFCAASKLNAEALLLALMDGLERISLPSGVHFRIVEMRDQIVVVEMGAEHALSDVAEQEILRRSLEKFRQP